MSVLQVAEIKMATLADQLEQMRGAVATSGDTGPSRLMQQLEEMRIRMNELARREDEMVAELDAAVRRMDERLLQDVRSIAAAHEARREDILHELQELAGRLNGLPQQDRRRPAINVAPQSLLSSPRIDRNQQSRMSNENERTIHDALSRYIGHQRQSH